jgi:hypothetical protein
MRTSASLCGSDGELVMVRVVVAAQDLEEALEALAGLEFPVNPELLHRGVETTIEFPAYAQKVPSIHASLGDGARIETVSMLAQIGL